MRVIRIECAEGDFARSCDSVVEGESACFVWLNRGKESVTLDLKSPTDRDLVPAVMKRSDVLVENLKPGSLKPRGSHGPTNNGVDGLSGHADLRQMAVGTLHGSARLFHTGRTPRRRTPARPRRNRRRWPGCSLQCAAGATVSDGILTLEGVNPVTLAFTNRPQRMVTHVDTQAFAETVWSEGENSFAAGPPNAVIVYREDCETKSAVVGPAELRMAQGGILTCAVSVFDGVLPPAMKQPGIIIGNTGGRWWRRRGG